ncbi:MAG: two-component sensor histidine kinase [Desulfomonile tiedjei]|uniref:histidine kinase n=1 Tax=Desulfomonile tiedjei TaxID=2358 RepID=A0A9D6V7U3_9BACT|nr:two-component sensor histidine kinase [Desulfomonile tiedjei]
MDEKENRNPAYYRKLRSTIALIVIIAAITPLIIISAITRHYFQVSYREKVLSLSGSLISKHKLIVETFLNERLSALRVDAMSYSFQELTRPEFLAQRLAVLQSEYGPSIVDLGVIDDQGTQVAYVGPFKLQGANYSATPWFKEAVRREHYVSDVFRGLRGMPHIVMTFRHEDQGKSWILRCTIDYETFNSLVDKMRIGKTGYAFIVNKAGDFQTKVPPEAKLPREPYVNFLASAGGSQNLTEVVERDDETGNECMNVMTSLKEGDWVLAHFQRCDEAYADLYSARLFAVSTFLLGVAAIIVVAVLLSGRIVKYIIRSDEKNRSMNEQLVQAGKLAALGEMAAGIAHEINNPLGIMLQEAGWIQDLLEDDEQEEQNKEYELTRSLNKIQIQGGRCKEITHKLLSFARKTDPILQNAGINELIEEVAALSEQRARFSNISISTALEENLPSVRVSQSEVQQVLLNLINNSMDAMDSKGGKIKIRSRLDGDQIVVDVSDTGPGIPKANMERIFEPFFTTKPVGKGTGLGLSICYGIMKKMGGQITISSELGHGTTFHVHFPLNEEQNPQS